MPIREQEFAPGSLIDVRWEEEEEEEEEEDAK